MHRKVVLESLFNNVTGLKTSNIIKKKLQHRYFPENIVKFLKTFFYRKPLAATSVWAKNLTWFKCLSDKIKEKSHNPLTLENRVNLSVPLTNKNIWSQLNNHQKKSDLRLIKSFTCYSHWWLIARQFNIKELVKENLDPKCAAICSLNYADTQKALWCGHQ